MNKPPNSRHVVKRGDGWAVVKPGAARASATAPTQAQAQARARTILGNDGGGEMLTHGVDNKIRSKDTIAPGHDPGSSKG